MAATTGVLTALLTTDWSRATSFVPAGNSSMMGLSSSAAIVILAVPLVELLWTLRTNTNEGLRRSSEADGADEVEDADVCWRVVGSEKSILPKSYGPGLPATEVVPGLGGTPIDGWVGRAVLLTSSGVTFWLP